MILECVIVLSMCLCLVSLFLTKSGRCAVEKLKKHQPFVQEYETNEQHTGREHQVGTQVETLGKMVGFPHSQLIGSVLLSVEDACVLSMAQQCMCY